MNRMLIRVASLSALPGLAYSAAAQPLTLTVASGTATMSVTGTNPYSATIHVTAGSPCMFTLSTTAANTVLESVEVE